MKIMRTALLPFLISIITFSAAFMSPADARVSAQAHNATGALSIGTGTFIAYATTTSTGANSGGPLTLSRSSAAQYFYVRNTGSISISAITIDITYAGTPGGTVFRRCDSGVLFASRNACVSGSVTQLSGSGSIALSSPPNSWYEFEIDPKNTVTPTVSITVSSSQISAGIVTNA